MKKLLIAFLLFTALSCENRIEHVERAFYFWKSDEWSFMGGEGEICEELRVKKLYVKFFEVNYNADLGAIPEAKTRMGAWQLKAHEIANVVPTVYLRNTVFLKSSKEELDLLADNVDFLIEKYLAEDYEGMDVQEIQMDCDWTISSKDNYFYFLEKLKSISKREVSVTLRLYPFKYPDKMGVPPVKKVMLMCYNLLSPLDHPTKNSILDISELESYLQGANEYPIEMDIALPIYSWAQVYQNEMFSNVLYCEAEGIRAVAVEEKPMWFRVTRDTLIHDVFLREGDKVKFEEITHEKLEDTIKLLRKHLKFRTNTTVALFHLDYIHLNNFNDEELDSFYSDFSK